MKFSKKLKQLRIQNNLKQSEVAEICNVTRSAVSNWENNRRFPEIESVYVLSKVFNVSVEELLGTDQTTVNLHNLEKDVAKTNNKISYKVPTIIAILWIVAFVLLLILIAPVVKDKYINYKDGNTIDMIDANSIEKVELVLKYYNDTVTIPFEEYPANYLSDEYETDNGKVYMIDINREEGIDSQNIWGNKDYVFFEIYIFDGFCEEYEISEYLLIKSETEHVNVSKENGLRINQNQKYRLFFYIRDNTYFLEVFLLE